MSKDNIYSYINDIVKIHEDLFPDATLQTQLEKFTEEMTEWFISLSMDNEDNQMEEACDMLIVACGIARFNPLIGLALQEYVLNKYYYNKDIKRGVKFFETLKYKMNKNKKRNWEDKDGYYKHVEE